MFFNKIIKIIVISLLVFVLAINLATWTTLLIEGKPYEYRGFYHFFEHVGTFPVFTYFTDTVIEMGVAFNNITVGETIVNIVTLGLPIIIKAIWYVSKAATLLIWDVIRILLWILEFLGIIPDLPVV